jgi:hypothetical protein
MQRLGWASCKRFVTLASGTDLIIYLNSLFGIDITSRGSLAYCMRHLSSSCLLKSPSGSKPLSTTMATKDTILQSDISKMKTEPDGSFKRADASFRNTIAKGSQFEPEIGEFQCSI